jgi:AAA+ ATPase superfamily predicted ATPase
MENPFKFGTIVDGEFFTDRREELKYVNQVLNSENHLVLISPRRFGKTSLVHKAALDTGRPMLFLNLEAVTDKRDFAIALLKRIFKLYPLERIKHLMRNFRFVPTLSMTPTGDSIDVSLVPQVDSNVVLEDVMALMDKVSTEDKRLIVVLDEFQEVNEIEKKMDHQLRAIMQLQTNINYVLLGSQESMMRDIFEHKKSPFYHFGTVMSLGKIPYGDFLSYISQRLSKLGCKNIVAVADSILKFTDCHPYYTQKLSFHVWNLLEEGYTDNDIVERAISNSNDIHDMDYERLWINLNKTDKKVVRFISNNTSSPISSTVIGIPPSTVFSSLKRLTRSGYIIKGDKYQIDDPFFARWIRSKI